MLGSYVAVSETMLSKGVMYLAFFKFKPISYRSAN